MMVQAPGACRSHRDGWLSGGRRRSERCAVHGFGPEARGTGAQRIYRLKKTTPVWDL